MKKSEILNLIAHSMADYFMQNDIVFPNYECSNYILKEIEKAGMLPPHFTNDDDYVGTIDELELDVIFCWEPEDEK